VTEAQQGSLPAPAALRRAASPLRHLKLSGRRDFWRLWLVGLIVFSVRWLETVAVAVVVYQRTGSPFLVAAITMLRMLPMGVFGAFIGAFAERIERRSAMIGVVLMMASSSLTLAVLAYAGRLEIWHLAIASFINGIAWATDNPVRRVMIGEVVGADQMSTAMSLDVGANNASRMLGPTVGGLMLATVGIAGAFALSVALYAIALAAALRVRYRNAASPADPGAVLARIAEGFALVRGNPRLIGVLTVTVIYNLFGWPFTSMVPVIGHDQLGLGPEGVGILASMDGVGAFCGAILAAVYLRPEWYARVFLGGSAIYMVMLIVFALTPWPLVAGGVLLFTGIGGAGFSIMQATLVYLAAPPDMRSRLLGVLSVCIGVGPIGFLLLGLEADWVGAPAATVGTGAVGLIMLAATRRWWRGM
jgi:MFS family permease